RVAYVLVNIEGARRRVFDSMLIDADNDLLARLNRALIGVAGVCDLLLRISALDRLHHAAHRVELLENPEGAVFHLHSQLLYEVRPTQWIDHVRHSRFISDDLLGAQ